MIRIVNSVLNVFMMHLQRYVTQSNLKLIEPAFHQIGLQICSVAIIVGVACCCFFSNFRDGKR